MRLPGRLLAGLALLFRCRRCCYRLLAAAQDFPSKPIKLIVPFPAGGPNDIIARMVGQRMSEICKQPVMIDNRGGQGGVLGTDAVAKAKPDGYTIALTSAGALAITRAGKDAVRSAQGFRAGHAGGDSAGNARGRDQRSRQNMSELVALAKSKPGKLNFASSGPGSMPHLAGELLKLTAKIDIVHVPYRGAAPAINDLLGQQVQMMFLDLPVILPQVQAGKLKADRHRRTERAPTLQDVPTTAEVGMPELLIENWYGMVAPAGTPTAIVAALNKITHEALPTEVKEKLAEQGLTTAGDSPEQFRAFIASETAKWAR